MYHFNHVIYSIQISNSRQLFDIDQRTLNNDQFHDDQINALALISEFICIFQCQSNFKCNI